MSTAQAAIPHASAANSVAARPRHQALGEPGEHPPGGHRRLAGAHPRRPAWSGPCCPAGSASRRWRPPPPRPAPRPARRAGSAGRPGPRRSPGPQVPSITRPPPSPGTQPSPGPSPTAAVSVPAASSLTRLSSAEVSAPSAAPAIALASTAPASTVGRNPPGTSARASSSAATASSGRPAPWPPSASGRCRPSSPWAARPGRSVSRYSGGAAVLGVHRRPDHRGRGRVPGPAAHRLGQCQVLFRQGQRHCPPHSPELRAPASL